MIKAKVKIQPPKPRWKSQTWYQVWFIYNNNWVPDGDAYAKRKFAEERLVEAFDGEEAAIVEVQFVN